MDIASRTLSWSHFKLAFVGFENPAIILKRHRGVRPVRCLRVYASNILVDHEDRDLV